MGWSIKTYTHVGGRARQEDSLLVYEPPGLGMVLAVADGMGGHAGGAEASTLAIEGVRGLFEDLARGKLAPWPRDADAVRAAMRNAWESVCSLGHGRRAPGTTLSLLWAPRPDQLLVGHVGDSFVWSRRPGCPWKQRTERHGFRNILTCCVTGKYDWPTIDETMTVASWEAQPGREMYLLATDGLVPDEGEIVLPLAPEKGEAGEAFLGRLHDRAREMGSTDNATGIVAWWRA